MVDPTALLNIKDHSEAGIHFPVKILLVDDKEENLYSLERLLENDEYKTEFIKCTSGNKALNVALKEELALILLDVQMPEMDGYEVAKFLKLNKKTSSIPIIFVTALDHEVNYILEGYKKGAVDYLFKPLNPAITRAKVKAFIQSYFQQKELEQKNIDLQNLAMLVNNSIDLMCIIDAKTHVVKSINPSWGRVLGLKTSDIVGVSADEVPHSGLCFLPLKNSQQNEVICENQMASTTGEKMWFSWSFVRKNNLWYGNGKNITKNKVFEKQLEAANEELEKKVSERTTDLVKVNEKLKEEIDKRKVIEEDLKLYNDRLIKANEELDSFVYVASHDLKAPIGNLENLFNFLRKKLNDRLNDDENELFDHVTLSLNKFNTTLKDLGSVISAQKDMEEEYEWLNLPAIVDDVKSDIENLINETNAQINTHFEIHQIYFSRKNLRSIVYNLLSNAIKYRSPERTPVVEINSQEDENYVILQVKDNGLGLKDSQKEKMFSMFKRFHTHVEGSGVGLYLLKKIIDNSGGKILLESTEGIGSDFKIYLKKPA